jgi:hypothetical protein
MAPLIVHILVALDLLLRRSDMVFMTGGEIAVCEIRLKPDGDSEAKPDTVPRRSRTSFRNEAGRRSEMKPDTRH